MTSKESALGEMYVRLKEACQKLPEMTPDERFAQALDFAYGNLALSTNHRPTREGFWLLAKEHGWSRTKFEEWAKDREWRDVRPAFVGKDTPGWVAACNDGNRVWLQDDACWRDDTPRRAWREAFGQEYPGGGEAIAHYDGGDVEFFLFQGGRVAQQSYPGNNAIYRIPV